MIQACFSPFPQKVSSRSARSQFPNSCVLEAPLDEPAGAFFSLHKSALLCHFENFHETFQNFAAVSQQRFRRWNCFKHGAKYQILGEEAESKQLETFRNIHAPRELWRTNLRENVKLLYRRFNRQLCQKIISFLCGWGPARCRDRIEDVAAGCFCVSPAREIDLNWMQIYQRAQQRRQEIYACFTRLICRTVFVLISVMFYV